MKKNTHISFRKLIFQRIIIFTILSLATGFFPISQLHAQCTTLPGTITLPIGTTNWNVAAFRQQNVIVPSGATLNITAIQNMTPGVSITVQPNGKVNLSTGGELRACNLVWTGVIVNGNAGLSQTAANQGVFNMSGNSIIRNAGLGIKVNSGGILTTKVARFIDNKVDVEFLPYSIATPPAVTNNLSSFYETQFLWTQFYSGTTSFLHHVKLVEVFLVHFAGCTFDNTYSGNLDPDIRGVGILSNNASMYCHRLNTTTSGGCQYYTSTKTKFSNFRTAIRANSTSNTLSRYSRVWQCEFINNDHDIELDKEVQWRIEQNSFDYYEPNALFTPGQTSFISINENNIGVYPASVKMSIYANTFTSWNTIITDFIYINKTYSELVIKKNTFNNTLPVNIGLAYGLKANDNNSGLKLTCNTYSGYYDRTLVFAGTNPTAIGSSTLASGNVFPTCAFALYNIFNFGSPITYYYGTGAGQNPGTCNVGSLTLVNLTGSGQQNACSNDPCTAPPRLAQSDIDKEEKMNVTLFPNPTLSVLHISSSTSLSNPQLKIVDVMGKVVSVNSTIENDGLKIDVQHLPNGIYFYEISSDNLSTAKGRFIKN